MFNFPSGMAEDVVDVLGSVVVLYLGLLCLSTVISLTLYILNGIGIMKMSKSLNISNGWLAFIPFASIFAFGRVGERYIKRDGTKSAKFSILLLLFYVLMFVIAVVLMVFLIGFLLSLMAFAEEAIAVDAPMTMEMFEGIIPVIICTVLTLAIELVYIILHYVCLWRVYSIFDSSNATLFLVLSIFFSFLSPIFIFVIRNKQPKVTYEERMSYFDNFNVNNEDNNAPMI